MVTESGVPTEELKKLPNSEILLKTRKLESVIGTIEKMVLSMRESDALIHKLNAVKEQYKRHNDLLEKNLDKIKKDELFDVDKVKQIRTESNQFTKSNLLEKYKTAESKYTSALEYYNAIDRNYYADILEQIIEDIY